MLTFYLPMGVMDAVFAVVFLALYPYRAAKGG
jgi:hypothetical protein